MGKRILCSHIKDFSLWLAGIILAVIPTVLKHFNLYLNAKEPYDFYHEFISDNDLLFVAFSTGALLLLEMMLREQFDNVRFFKTIITISNFFILVFYVISLFSNGWKTHISYNTMKIFNIALIAVTILFGIIYFFISYKKTKKTNINNQYSRGYY